MTELHSTKPKLSRQEVIRLERDLAKFANMIDRKSVV